MKFDPNEIPNRFDFAQSQERIYRMWQDRGHFHPAADPAKKPFTIVIPPPNVTGALHLGHALNNTLQDIIIRMKRMQGFNALWIPGTDHAGIATQAVVERRIREEEGKTRHDLGREKLVQRIWEWKEQYEDRILGQLKRMGCSCDWKRTRFTLDDVCAKAVRHTFFDLFQKQLIYRGKRLVNWDTFLQTAVSDDEVFSKTVQGNFWHIKYPVIDPKPGEPDHVIIATTRPETMLGDTAVAVHPDPASALNKYELELKDRLARAGAAEQQTIEEQLAAIGDRRQLLLNGLIQLKQMAEDGRQIRLPLLNREIPLVTDSWAKPELGSGCVKITPAHDPNDYEVAIRCGLPMINIMNPEGTLNAETGPYQGLSLKAGRQQVVADLDALGLLDRIEDRDIELPHSDRSKTPIEPFLADQWFVKMDSLAQSAMDAVTSGRIEIIPPRYERGYLDWLSEKRDWPVSRQLWWGHQIPVWSLSVETMEDLQRVKSVVEKMPGFSDRTVSIQFELGNEADSGNQYPTGLTAGIVHVCLQQEGTELEDRLVDAGFVREQDVLDTWFSSALWPHSTLGWPDQTADLEYFFPTSTLITSRDIITLWVARMVLASLNNTGDIPFERVYIHPKILDGFGETMSKSKGNGIDPLDVMDKFGADALRFGMAQLTTETQDVRLPVRYECPHCGNALEQTVKNRELPSINCKSCTKSFSTQWARTEADKALPRGWVVSDRFELARNFTNKLWNASRFAMIHLQDMHRGPIDVSQMTLEDRWILSRLATVSQRVTDQLDSFRFADATRELYDFAWDEFCSFYVEMLKDRFSDDNLKTPAQRMLAFTLDSLLRLLHPFIPFITEEIWQLLSRAAPQRGYLTCETASESLIIAEWPDLPESWQQPEIEHQFSQFQHVLGAIREIRSAQNLPPKARIEFSVRCDLPVAGLLQPMSAYFDSMANATMTSAGPDVEAPKISATVSRRSIDVFVSLAGLIDVQAETSRLVREKSKIESAVQARENKLHDRKFVDKAPEQVVLRTKKDLEQLKQQLARIQESLHELERLNRS